MIVESHERRTQILAAARSVVDEGGAKALTARAVTKAVGVSRPLLYHYFGSVESLVDAIVTEYVDEFSEALARFDGDTPAADSDASVNRYSAARFVSCVRPKLSDGFCLAPTSASDMSAAYMTYLEKCSERLIQYISTSTNPLWRHPTCIERDDDITIPAMLYGLAMTLVLQPEVDNEKAASACVTPFFNDSDEPNNQPDEPRPMESPDTTRPSGSEKTRKGLFGRLFGA